MYSAKTAILGLNRLSLSPRRPYSRCLPLHHNQAGEDDRSWESNYDGCSLPRHQFTLLANRPLGQGQATVTNPARFYVFSLGRRSVCTPDKLWVNYLPVELPAHVACLSKLLPA